MSDIKSNDEVGKILGSSDLRKLINLLLKVEVKEHYDNSNPLQKITNIMAQVASAHDVSGELARRTNAPVIPINDLLGKNGCQYSEEEKTMRCQLATLYRLMDLHGWTLNIYNHITVRISGDSKEFFINPLGLLYREVTASCLVKINLDGHTLDPGSTVFGINKAGWNLHAALHEIRHDIRCLIHSHIPDVIAVGCFTYGLLPVSQEAVDLLDESSDSLSRGVRYHDYWGVAVTKEEWASLAEDIGPRCKVLFLRNHGVIVGGRTCIEAWTLMRQVVVACENQIRLLQTKGEKGLLSMEYKSYQHTVANGDMRGDSPSKTTNQLTMAELEFEALMRMLDNAGYRTGYEYGNGDLRRKLGK